MIPGMRTTTALQLIVVLLSLAVASINAEKGSCRAARRCCDGKDADCVVEINNPLLDAGPDYDEDDYEAVEPCYCDHGCLEVGDCCPDFKDYCGVIDCQVGDWSAWSECDVSCGTGTSVRTRPVIRPEANGGVQCPVLEEKRTCEATRCSKNRLDKVSALRETAMLVPGKYARHNFNEKYDVRSNLRSFRKKESKRYCVVFKVEKATKACQRERETYHLTRANSVCVMCDDKAQRDRLGGRCKGHGVPNSKPTKFKSLFNPRCHGKWIRTELTDECPCRNGPDFIFV